MTLEHVLFTVESREAVQILKKKKRVAVAKNLNVEYISKLIN